MKRRRAVSSIYGFIMIFLLAMASIQTWSYAVSSEASIQSASVHQHQLEQMQSLERLTLTERRGNLTILNTGQVPSTVEFIRFLGMNDSKTFPEGVQVPEGSSISRAVPPGDAIQVVTALGNTFAYSPTTGVGTSLWAGPALRGGQANAQVFQSPYYSSSFYLSEGSAVYAFSSSGSPEWSFDAGDGYVTDVIPLSNGEVYVSTGYGSSSNVANLFELSSGGAVIQTFPARTFQTAGSSQAAASFPVVKGQGPLHALYDGWFYSSSGPFTSLKSDSLPLLGSDSSAFYFYQVTPVSNLGGSCPPPGNEVLLSSYLLSPSYGGGIKLGWEDYVYFGTCNPFPEQLVGSSVDNGVLAALFSSPPYAASISDSYPAQNPFLAVVSSSGSTIFAGQAPNEGYTSIASDGTNVYMALPASSQIQVYSLSTSRFATYDIGIQASRLLFERGSLFAISGDSVEVYTPSMTLEDRIDFAPLTLASWSNSFPQEQALMAPSFLVLNGSSYVALVENQTGYSSLTLGRYS